MELSMKVLDWMADGDTGLSSESIALWITARKEPKGWGACTPSDPDDLGRCLRLLRAIPELRPRLPEMTEASPEWAHMLTYWCEIEKSMIEEVGIDWEKARSAPKTYALMRENAKESAK